MSAHDHAPADAHEAAEHDDHDDHAEAPPPEPESPAWLPLLGGALFLVGLLFFLLTGESEPSAAAEPAASAAPAAAPAPAAPSAATLRPRRPPNMKALPPRDAVGAQVPRPPEQPGHEGHGH
jgi:hypothetical protein